MALVNLKNDPKEKETSTMVAPSYEEPAYPYGLCINLCDETLKKLGMPMPAIGATITFVARATVTSVSQYEEAKPDAEDGGSLERSVGLQITDMDLGAPAARPMADRMYRS